MLPLRRALEAWPVVALVYGAVVLATSIPTVLGPGVELSAYDEPTHADSAWALSHGDVPARGRELTPVVREFWSCNGQDGVGLPPCDAIGEPSEYPARGENYNWGHPPTFYALTGLAARAVSAVVPDVGFVLAARLLGSVWLVAGMVVLHRALLRLGVPAALAVTAPVLLPTIPVVMHASTTVNNDAAAVLAGASALWVLARVLDRPSRPASGWLIATAAILATFAASTKVISAVPFLGLAVLVGWWAWRDRRGDRRAAVRSLVLALSMAVPVAVVHFGWRAFQSGRGVSGWKSPIAGHNTRPFSGSPVDEWAPSLVSGFDLTRHYYLQPPLRGDYVEAWVSVVGLLVASAFLLALVVRRGHWAGSAVGGALLVGSLAYPLFVEIQSFMSSDGQRHFPEVNARYGMSLLPFAVAALALVVDERRCRTVLHGIVAVGLVLTWLNAWGLLDLLGS